MLQARSFALRGSIAIISLVAGAACSAPAADSPEEAAPSGDEEVASVKQSINPQCQHPTVGAIKTYNGTIGEFGQITYQGACFNGGDYILVWATDTTTNQMVLNYQWVKAAADNSILPGFISGVLTGACPALSYVQIHAVDIPADVRADSPTYGFACPSQ